MAMKQLRQTNKKKYEQLIAINSTIYWKVSCGANFFNDSSSKPFGKTIKKIILLLLLKKYIYESLGKLPNLFSFPFLIFVQLA